MCNFKRLCLLWLILAACLTAALGCAKSKNSLPDPMANDPDAGRQFFTPVKEPPSYALFAKSLEYQEKALGVRFRRTEMGTYAPYSAAAWNHFSIADEANNCLYDVKYDRLRSFQQLGAGYATLLDMQVEKGPCGIAAANLNMEALDRLQNLEGGIVSQKLIENLQKGTNFIGDRRFLQETLQAPWILESSISGLEPFINSHLTRVQNPLDVVYGDIVFFSEYIGERTVGIYIGYGMIACNRCFRTEVHKISAEVEYHVYRLYTGFAQVSYKVHHDSVLHRMLSNP
ncbi:MAG: hypothetical protein GX444_17715 [Myxococcales bacterium]|nr:hypothetical protein [Myxococcales bacterium]